MKKALTRPDKILAVMFDLCGGAPRPLAYEDIVVEAFRRYPEDFQLRGYPQYPDSSDIHKPLYSMKRKGLVAAADKTFQLTQRGVDVAKELSHPQTGDRERLTKQEQHELARLLKSEAFRLYQCGEKESILDTDFYDFYGVSVRTPKGDFLGRLNNVDLAVSAHCEKQGDETSAALSDLNGFLKAKFNHEIEARR